MMISPEGFYEMELKGKTPEQIMTVIRGLKREIGRLKNIVEHPDYGSREWVIHPSEKVQIYMNREYLEYAKQALAEAGGIYTPSATERKVMDFEDNISYISKIEFSIGGYFGGYENRTYIINGDKIHINKNHCFAPHPYDTEPGENEETDKEAFLAELGELHIGEWRKYYDLRKFGCFVLDGTQWHLNIYFSNGRRPVKIYGDNAYPYNFDRLKDLFDI